MKVSQLIAHLSLLNPDQEIMVQGYEGGLADITTDKISEHSIILNVNTEDWYGPHDFGDSMELSFQKDWLDKQNLSLVNAYVIHRSSFHIGE